MFKDASNKRLSTVEDAPRRSSQATKGNRHKSVTFSPNLIVHTIDRLPTLADDSSVERTSRRSPSVASPRTSSGHRHAHSLPTLTIPSSTPAKAQVPTGKLKKRRHSVATVSPVEGSGTLTSLGPQVSSSKKHLSSPVHRLSYQIYSSQGRQPTAHSTPVASPVIGPAGEPERESRSERHKSSDRSRRRSSSRRHSSLDPRTSRVYERVEIPSAPTQVAWRTYFRSNQSGHAFSPNLPAPTTYGPIYADNAITVGRIPPILPVYPTVVYNERSMHDDWAESLHHERGRSPSQKRLSSSSRQPRVHEHDENNRDAPTRGRRTEPKQIYAPRAPVPKFRSTGVEYVYAYQESNQTPQSPSPAVLFNWSPDIGAHHGIHTPLQVAPATLGSPSFPHQPLYSPAIGAPKRRQSLPPPIFTIGIAPNEKGSGVFAAKDLQPGEIVLREHPFLIVEYAVGSDPRDAYNQIIESLKPGMLERAEELVRWDQPRPMGRRELASVLCTHGVYITLRNYATSGFDGHLALFPTLSLVNHSCGPNALFCWDGETYTLSLIVVRPIRAGQEISVCYAGVPIGSPAPMRHQFLLSTYHFQCACQHCSDGPAMARGDAVRRELGAFWVPFGAGEQMGSRRETVPRMDDWLHDARIDEGALIQRHLRAVQLIEQEGLEAADDTAFEGVADHTGNGPAPPLPLHAGHRAYGRGAQTGRGSPNSFAVQGNPHVHELSHMPRELTHHVDALAACYGALADEQRFITWTQRGIQARRVSLAALQMGGSFRHDVVYQASEEALIRREIQKFEDWVRHPRRFPVWGSRAMVSAAAQERLGAPALPYGSGSVRRR